MTRCGIFLHVIVVVGLQMVPLYRGVLYSDSSFNPFTAYCI